MCLECFMVNNLVHQKKSNWTQNNQKLVKVKCYAITGLVVQIRSKNVDYFTRAYKTPPTAVSLFKSQKDVGFAYEHATLVNLTLYRDTQ